MPINPALLHELILAAEEPDDNSAATNQHEDTDNPIAAMSYGPLAADLAQLEVEADETDPQSEAEASILRTKYLLDMLRAEMATTDKILGKTRQQLASAAAEVGNVETKQALTAQEAHCDLARLNKLSLDLTGICSRLDSNELKWGTAATFLLALVSPEGVPGFTTQSQEDVEGDLQRAQTLQAEIVGLKEQRAALAARVVKVQENRETMLKERDERRRAAQQAQQEKMEDNVRGFLEELAQMRQRETEAAGGSQTAPGPSTE